MGARPAALSILFLLTPLAASAAPPRPAPRLYATANYGLTFRSPPGATYCPLPRDWVGSDHGTVLFLENPGDCGGSGYPSSSRNFERNAARIELYYGYDLSVGDPLWPKQPPCRAAGRVRMLGAVRSLCRGSAAGLEVRARATYRADVPAEAILTLVTRPERLARDLATFRRMAASLRTCSSLWPAVNGHRPFVVGVGPRCPRVGTF